ncbi:MAG: collagen-like protein [Lachnospiraceae bacterium]|nr:collagen-like protein [Lachnospiraceae bacterium]
MKNRLVMIVLGIIVILAAGAVVYAIYSTQSGKEVFAEDGYIIVYDESNTEQPAKKYHFNEGTAFKRSYEGTIQFRDTDGNTVTADANSFVHYDSGASASLSKSVLLDLDEVESTAVSYYGLNSDTTVDRSGSSYSISTSDEETVDLTNYLWKTGENRYMMVSDHITVAFQSGERREFDDYVELVYQEGGMVTIINGDTVIRDASKNTYLETDTGVKINLATQVVLKDNDIRMTLGQMTTDAEQVVSVLPADVPALKIVIPEFNFTVIDGKNGEAGPDGQNGADGIDGAMGADGISGQSGRTGLEGYDGEDGDAGQPGTSGRSGSNGAEGAEGANGAGGSAGAAGASGAQGAAGGAGAAGAAGPAGPSGSSGQEGYDGEPGEEGNSPQVNDPDAVLKEVPIIYWENGPATTESEIKGSFGFKMSIDEKVGGNIEKIEISLIDVASGKVVRTQNVQQMSVGENAEKTQLSGLDRLAPATEYRLVIYGTYSHLEKPVTTRFEDRTLITDGYPLEVRIFNVEARKIDVELINRNADAKEGDTSNTNGFPVGWELTDSNGNVFTSGETRLSENITLNTNPTIINKDGSTSDHTIIETSSNAKPLDPDTLYYFTIKSVNGVSENVPQKYIRIPVRTLKRTPALTGMDASVNLINQSFEFSVPSDKLSDPDQAITRFRYEITDVATGNMVKTIYAPDRNLISCYVDGDLIKADGTYTVRVIAEAFDNRKNIEIDCAFETPLSLNGITNYTWLTYDNPDQSLTANGMGLANPANFVLHVPSELKLKEKSIYFTISSDESDTRTYTVDYNVWKEHVTTGQNNEKTVTFTTVSFNNLKSQTIYHLTVSGSLDFGEEGDVERKLGAVRFLTPEYSTVGGNSNQIQNNSSPICFKVELVPSGTTTGEGTSVNTSAYAVSQVGSELIYNDQNFIGGVHVSLYSPEANDPSNWILMCEADIPMKMQSSNAVPKKDSVTLDDFPGAPSASSFINKYKVHIDYAYDQTSHKNRITVNSTDSEFEVAKAFPDPSSVSVSVIPITKENYEVEVGKAPDPADKYDDYDSTTVIGFAVKPVGLDNGAVDTFDRIDFYAFDALKYEDTVGKRVAGFKSSAGDGSTYVSPELTPGSPLADDKYFYPQEDDDYLNDPLFMAKLSIKLNRKENNKDIYLPTMPYAVFLFEDFTDSEKNVCTGYLASQKGKYEGYDKTACVSDQATGGKFNRGRNYEFTIRLKSNQSTMGTSGMYPEVLGEDKAGIIKCPTTMLAPYEKPSYYVYPRSSGIDYLEYGYYVKSVDYSFIRENCKTTAGTALINGDVANTNLFPDADGTIRISGLRKLDHVEFTVSENLYINGYLQRKDITLFKRLFTGTNNAPTAEFSIEKDDALSRLKISLKFRSVEEAKSITALEGHFVKGSVSDDVRLDISSVTGQDMIAYVKYSDLAAVAKTGDNVEISIIGYYDTGEEGFNIADWTNGNIKNYVAIREAGEDNVGNYIIPYGSESSFKNKAQTSNDINAEGSLFRITKSSNTIGAENSRVKETFEGDNPKPGIINLTILDWKKDNAWRYDTGSGSRARIGGAYDSSITQSNLPFAISKVAKTENTIKGTGDAPSLSFEVGSIVPQVNLHTETGWSIRPGVNSADVDMEIIGVSGAGAIYGSKNPDAATPDYNNGKYGSVYALLYRSENGSYIPVKTTNGQRQARYEIKLGKTDVTNAPGDGIYTFTIGSDNNNPALEANTTYYFQLVYYESTANYNNDLGGPELANKRKYLIDMKRPELNSKDVWYPINTSDTVQIKEETKSVVYMANGWYDKKLSISYQINGSTSTLKPNQQFVYSLYDDSNNLVMTHRELEHLVAKAGNNSILFDVSPETVKIGKDSNGKAVYLNFGTEGGASGGNIHNLKLRLVPMNLGTEFTEVESIDGYANGKTNHSEEYTKKYNKWLAANSLGADRGKEWDDAEGRTYIEFINVKKTGLASPFYNVRAYPGKGEVKFRVSIVDADGVVYENGFMVRAFVNGAMKDLGTSQDHIFSTKSANTITVDGLGDETEVTLKVYCVENYESLPPDNGIYHYKGAIGTTADTTNISNKAYNMKSFSEKTTHSDGFAPGYVEVVRRSLADNSVYIDFTNPSNILYCTNMHIDITMPGGSIESLPDFANPFADDSTVKEVLNSGADTIYRFKGIDEGKFKLNGIYTIAIRMRVTPGPGNPERYVDKVVSFTIA